MPVSQSFSVCLFRHCGSERSSAGSVSYTHLDVYKRQVYNTYLNSFKNEDGSVNWLPVCADAHGFVVNLSLIHI